jgi:hypothetical protein
MWNGFSLAGNFNRIALAAQRMCTQVTRYRLVRNRLVKTATLALICIGRWLRQYSRA